MQIGPYAVDVSLSFDLRSWRYWQSWGVKGNVVGSRWPVVFGRRWGPLYIQATRCPLPRGVVTEA